MDTLNPQATHPEELTLREFLGVLRRVRWLIITVAAVAGLTTAVAASVMQKTYVATVLMAVATNSSAGGQLGALGSLVSQVGGLSSLAGLSPEADSKKAESIAVLQSQVLTERYIDQNRLLPILYARDWDGVTKRWKLVDTAKIPTLWKANEFFKKNVRTVTTDPKSGLVTLKISWRDPQTAANWANGLITLTNDYLRKKAIDESERNIAYLTDQAAKTDVVGVKQAIYTLMESEINKAMLARGNDEYAFRVLDPAAAPERPSSPRPLLWTAIAVLASILLTGIAAFGWAVWNKN